MRAQLEALIELTQLPSVRLQIIPFDAGGHAAAGGSFSILRFPDGDLPDVVYVEQLTSALYLDKAEDVEQYTEAMERLCIEAKPPEPDDPDPGADPADVHGALRLRSGLTVGQGLRAMAPNTETSAALGRGCGLLVGPPVGDRDDARLDQLQPSKNRANSSRVRNWMSP